MDNWWIGPSLITTFVVLLGLVFRPTISRFLKNRQRKPDQVPKTKPRVTTPRLQTSGSRVTGVPVVSGRTPEEAERYLRNELWRIGAGPEDTRTTGIVAGGGKDLRWLAALALAKVNTGGVIIKTIRGVEVFISYRSCWFLVVINPVGMSVEVSCTSMRDQEVADVEAEKGTRE